MATKRVNTATLIRGQLYTLRHPDSTPQNPIDSLRFERGKPIPISEPKILTMLENMVEETEDGEGEVYEKPLFRIDRNVAMEDAGNIKKPTRLSADRSVKKNTRRRKARA